MDQIAEILQPYKETIGNIAGLVTFSQFLSGAFICNDIRKKKSTKGFSIVPFVGGLVLGLLSLKYGAILRDDAMIRINFIGLALNIVYIMFFYWYTPNQEKTGVWAQIGVGGALVAGVLSYAQYEDEAVLEHRFGLIITAFLLALVASPFLSLGEIIRNKSTEGLPFPIILSGTAVSFMWLLYGLCLNNGIFVIQNLIIFSLSAIQLSLFAIYPSSNKSSSSKKKKNKKNN